MRLHLQEEYAVRHLVYEDKSESAMSSAVDLKTKEEKDAELDRRIEALRKKNEALVKRYQEIEEDKKKAEQEGIAVTTPRKPRPHEPETDRRKTEKENLTVTVDLSKQTGLINPDAFYPSCLCTPPVPTLV
ncbi:Coiled-coil domain-containing protein 9 [Collichthys lucidus]|uniref:Coiled-coil domain-containing protein 9 n=1 Tax=Collichthys lucidus TaxID=240159 RepID=A0A4U5UZH1_COLLU|nr:Coiled-coil domain-containing protein 9 [Collichthys lucidus]